LELVARGGIEPPTRGFSVPMVESLAAARAISGASRSSGQTGLALQLLEPRIGAKRIQPGLR